MGRIVELPSIRHRSTSRRRGLRKLSPDLIGKARDENAAQVTRIGLTFIGTAAFCLLSLLTPDRTATSMPPPCAKRPASSGSTTDASRQQPPSLKRSLSKRGSPVRS
jgi:hypothetical protein